MRSGEELRIDTRAGEVALLRWPAACDDAPNVLCLHGWLDNAASFLPLAQHARNLNLYALDFPGHGHSAHRNPGARYTFAEYVADIDAIIDALGWDFAHLMGHSLGGGIACVYSAAEPERVGRLIVIDGLGPLSMNPENTVAQLRKSLDWLRRERKPLRQFDRVEEMAQARLSAMKMSHDAAVLICERAARAVQENGKRHFVWRNDPALNWPSPTMLTEPQIINCLSAIKAPLLSFHAVPFFNDQVADVAHQRMGSIANGQFVEVAGSHYFHMETPEQIASGIESFITQGSDDHD